MENEIQKDNRIDRVRVQTWNRKPELCQPVRALQLIYTTIKDPLGILFFHFKNAHTPRT